MSTRLDQATVDLLGVLAYGELTAFERPASDARLAPTIGDKHALATMAAAVATLTSAPDHNARSFILGQVWRRS